jgi:hypothetical protein
VTASFEKKHLPLIHTLSISLYFSNQPINTELMTIPNQPNSRLELVALKEIPIFDRNKRRQMVHELNSLYKTLKEANDRRKRIETRNSNKNSNTRRQRESSSTVAGRSSSDESGSSNSNIKPSEVVNLARRGDQATITAGGEGGGGGGGGSSGQESKGEEKEGMQDEEEKEGGEEKEGEKKQDEEEAKTGEEGNGGKRREERAVTGVSAAALMAVAVAEKEEEEEDALRVVGAQNVVAFKDAFSNVGDATVRRHSVFQHSLFHSPSDLFLHHASLTPLHFNVRVCHCLFRF